MPYDELTYVISEKFNMKFSKAKITIDITNVSAAGLICIISIQSLGAIGIGTLVAAYFVGKILELLLKHFQNPLENWLNKKEVFILKRKAKYPCIN